jgi:hypothetical protein
MKQSVQGAAKLNSRPSKAVPPRIVYGPTRTVTVRPDLATEYSYPF